MEIHTASKVLVRHPQEDKILLVKRVINNESWYEAAGGRVDVDFRNKQAETLEACAIRESKEELGLDVNLLEYVGSYHFFWTIKPNACSICAVFTAKMKGEGTLRHSADETGSQVFPEWIDFKDINENKISIGSAHVGLLDIIKKIISR